ncbi:unnamed protein product [Mytilus coruscus]|uniref:Uncharacterized protein n=1 Tax=Mytilus coruscus TaxID=42192 RepID=A0A6J8BB79_MYTCO|nr:unnamed protein product [Mytilus coruscus]
MDTSVDLTEEEVRNIIAAFKDMHMKPNAESPDAFKYWIKEFSTQKSLYTGYIPRIPIFSGDNKGDNTHKVWSAIDELDTQDDDDTVKNEAEDDQEHFAEQQDTGIKGDDLRSEESDTVDPVSEPDGVTETDHQVADTTLSDDTEQPEQDTTVYETVNSVPQPDIEATLIEPRRFVRARTSTATTKYKDFIVSKKSQPQPDWKSRADYLKEIASSGAFKGMEDHIVAGLLKVATEKWCCILQTIIIVYEDVNFSQEEKRYL